MQNPTNQHHDSAYEFRSRHFRLIRILPVACLALFFSIAGGFVLQDGEAADTPDAKQSVSATGLIKLTDPPGDRSHQGGTNSGAYRALSFWGDSRAYPAADIPSDGFYRGYEKATSLPNVTQLNHLRKGGGGQDGGPLKWEAIGPLNGGGRTLTLAFHPDNPDVMFAGSASGGLWKSTTAGMGAEAWTRIDTGHPVLGVSTIAFEPGNPDVMYIGTGEVYNHRSAGDLAASRRTRGSYGIGILKTEDGGQTWSKSLDWSYNQRQGVWMIRVNPLRPRIVWAATTEGIYKSKNAGATWELKLDVAMATDLIVHPTVPSVLLVACGDLESPPNRGIYRTTNGGNSWDKITGGGLPTGFKGKIQFGVTPADPNVVYASIGNGFDAQNQQDNFTWLFRSDDFGETFTLKNTTDYSRYQGWFAHDVAVHPTNPDEIVCIGIEIWKSTNAGSTLVKIANGSGKYRGDIPPGDPEGNSTYSHVDHHDVIYHPTNHDAIYVANDGGVFRSLDGGSTWRSINGGLQSQQFYGGTYSSATDPDLAMGGLQDNGSVKYLGDSRWFRGVYGGDGGWCAIDPTDPNVVYATSQRLNVVRSLNGGNNFSNISPPDLGGDVVFIAPFIMSPTDSQKLYAGDSYFFLSLNRGDDWFVGNGGDELDGNPLLLIAPAPSNGEIVYAATIPGIGRGGVYRTGDGGAAFTDITGSIPDRYPGDLTVDPTDEATVYLTMSGFGSSHVFKSIDYGNTWVDIDRGNLPDVPTMAVIVDPLYPDHVYIGNDVGVFVTHNEGKSWFRLANGLTNAALLTDLGIFDSNRKLRAFTHGQGVYEHDLIGGLTQSGDARP